MHLSTSRAEICCEIKSEMARVATKEHSTMIPSLLCIAVVIISLSQIDTTVSINCSFILLISSNKDFLVGNENPCQCECSGVYINIIIWKISSMESL